MKTLKDSVPKTKKKTGLEKKSRVRKAIKISAALICISKSVSREYKKTLDPRPYHVSNKRYCNVEGKIKMICFDFWRFFCIIMNNVGYFRTTVLNCPKNKIKKTVNL